MINLLLSWTLSTRSGLPITQGFSQAGRGASGVCHRALAANEHLGVKVALRHVSDDP